MREWCLGRIGTYVDATYLNRAGRLDWEAVWTGNYVYSSSENFELLYDHTLDPFELNNLYDDPAYVEVRQELQEILDELAVAALTIPDEPEAPPLDVSGSSGSCFIATAAFGTPLAAELDALRAFRDATLFSTAIGRAFADTYYRASPPAADWIAIRPVARGAVRFLLGFILAPNQYPWIGVAALLLLLTFRVRRHTRRNAFPLVAAQVADDAPYRRH